MSWTFPTSLFRTGTVLDWMDVNEQLSAFASTIDGQISEHNMDDSVSTEFISQDKISANFAMRAFNTARPVDPLSASTNFSSIPMTEQWFTVSSSSLDVKGPGGRVVIIYSFQTIVTGAITANGPGLQFCIDVDGSPRPQALVGSGDMGNERIVSDNVTVGTIPNHGSASIYHNFSAQDCVGAFILDAGSHTVHLLARNPFTLKDGTTVPQFIGNIEVIALHCWTD